MLSDFRVHRGNEFDRLLTELLAALMKAGVITLRTMAQDGTRVRAATIETINVDEMSLGHRAGSLVAQYDVSPSRLFRSEKRKPNGGWCRPRRMRLDAVVLSRAIAAQPLSA